MPRNITTDPIASILAAGGVTPSSRLVEALSVYLEELVRWNARVNLTGLKDRDQLIAKHIGDTLTLLPVLPRNARTVLDIGTGAGVPGLILKLLRPDLDITLVDALRKRVSFLMAVISRINLSGIWAEHGRVGGQGQIPRRVPDKGFDVVVTRATFPLEDFLRLGGPLISPRGTLVAMKGPLGATELDQLRASGQLTGWHAEAVNTQLPVLGHTRTLILFSPAPADKTHG